MEAAIYDIQMRAELQERLLAVGVHAAPHGLHPRHPFHACTLHEAVHDLLLPSVGCPEDMPRLQAGDDGRMAVAVMQLELVYPYALRRPVRKLQAPLPILGAILEPQPLQPLWVDVLHGVAAQPRDMRRLLQREAVCEQVLRAARKLLGAHVCALRPEGDGIRPAPPAFRAAHPLPPYAQP